MDIKKEVLKCLFNNILEERFEETERLLEVSGVNPNELIDGKGINLLHLAAGVSPEEYALKVINLLLKYGGDPNIRSEDGMTALHVGATWGRVGVIKALLSAGADPNFVDLEGKTPIEYAGEQDDPEVLKCFLTNEPHSPQKYKLTLDKVLISNGFVQGEYYPKDLLNVESFSKLDYIEQWFAKSPITEYSKSNHLNVAAEGCFESCVSSDMVTAKETLESNKSKKNNTLYESCVSHNSGRTHNHKSHSTSMFSDDASFNHENSSQISGVFPLDVSHKIDISKQKVTNHYQPHQNYNSRSHIQKEKCEILDFYDNEVVLTGTTSANICDSSSNLEADCSSSECTQTSDHLNRALVTSVNSSNKTHKTFSHLNNGLITTTRANNSVSFINETIPSVAEEYKYRDKEMDVCLIEKRILVNPPPTLNMSANQSGMLTSVSSLASSLPMSINYDTDTLRKELTSYGICPGPITKTTKRVYLKRLHNIRKNPVTTPNNATPQCKNYSIELQKTLRDSNWASDLSAYISLERKLAEQFEAPNPNKKWREGIIKSSFTYLLLDPRITNNLPCKAETMQSTEVWKSFIDAIFYIGKGKRSRPYCHLYDAVALHNSGKTKSDNDKEQTILNIWNDKCGVICLHIFQNVIPVEAYTREAAMIEVMGLKNLKNIKPGNYYGSVAAWSLKEKKLLGVYLLYRAMLIFLNEGERQLRPGDLK